MEAISTQVETIFSQVEVISTQVEVASTQEEVISTQVEATSTSREIIFTKEEIVSTQEKMIFSPKKIKFRLNFMKTLYIMRHAKSSWTDADVKDFERHLNERGRRTAPLMGELMREKNLTPDLILSSSATRAKETAELVKEAANFDCELNFDGRIYEATPTHLIEVVEEQHDTYASILLVGHNPGFEGLVRFLTAKIEEMPTAALAVVELPIEKWNDINGAKGVLKELFRPKEL